ncbi:MAG: DUF2141 domain-containing protein [Flavobacteriia bacterium]|jgi:uncharacterized protein (DUF2141 family)|nr:DUF2141 domain-containing protein [Flavobacteriia bacterium]
MKLLFVFISLAFLGTTYDLEVQVEGIPNKKGTLFIGLFNSSATFPNYGKQYKGVVVTHEGKSHVYKFKNLPKDTYALAIYHDENKNGKLDKNLFGAPTEAYGFSNNARETFSAPSFEAAKVVLDRDKKCQIRIK